MKKLLLALFTLCTLIVINSCKKNDTSSTVVIKKNQPIITLDSPSYLKIDTIVIAAGIKVVDSTNTILNFGFVIDTIPSPVVNDTKPLAVPATFQYPQSNYSIRYTQSPYTIPELDTAGRMSITISGLTGGKTYYIRAFVKTKSGRIYSNEDTVVTKVNVPSLTTVNPLPLISDSFFVAGSLFTNFNGSPITQYGIIWRDSYPPLANPLDTANKTKIVHFGTPQLNTLYTDTIKGLLPNTPYWLTAFAVNSLGVRYGYTVSINTYNYHIGQQLNGGKIFYIDNTTGTSGLIVAPTDVINPTPINAQTPNLIPWYNGKYIEVANTVTTLGKGSTNTSNIIRKLGAGNYAANLAKTYTVPGGTTGWYLPSRDELNLLYQNASLIGGFAQGNYWSSSEFIVNNAAAGTRTTYGAYTQSFSNGTIGVGDTTNYYYVRYIKAF